MTFEDLYMKHEGKTAVIFGKGPSLDLWIESGRVLPNNNVTISVNSAGAANTCEYNITRHNHNKDLGADGQWIIPIVDGWEYNNARYSDVNFKKVPDGALWFIPIQYRNRIPSREEMRDCRVMLTPGGSCINAIMLAYYIGASNILFIGVDGTPSPCYSENYSKSSNCVLNNASTYDKLRTHSDMFANMLFKDKFKHWAPDLK